MYNLEEIAFQIISYAGDSLSSMFQALSVAKEGDFIKSKEMMKKAQELLKEAHKAQKNLIEQEVQGKKTEYSILMVHAQDHLMKCILAKKLINELIDIYKKDKGDK
ncbi:PTS lactose/cellobiose transporter subunit IIA [Crassaminicella profunda]|uniref:PTS lactose/cellobiose transporter subunit IIA n=1 Tax=Crassaminicella profunda TaxID=1286698 RepID=UPI001CA7618C|nr:PTS lactose/cellobiose transporter subunit IIA [Crassaminicella profunda]QZY55805.1 PTS lactose/cellobiose transporter subunit IIA [Crassaminicella profunda]